MMAVNACWQRQDTLGFRSSKSSILTDRVYGCMIGPVSFSLSWTHRGPEYDLWFMKERNHFTESFWKSWFIHCVLRFHLRRDFVPKHFIKIWRKLICLFLSLSRKQTDWLCDGNQTYQPIYAHVFSVRAGPVYVYDTRPLTATTLAEWSVVSCEG